MDDEQIRDLAARGLENILTMTDSATAIEVVGVMLRSLVASCPDQMTREGIIDGLIMSLSADKRIDALMGAPRRIVN